MINISKIKDKCTGCRSCEQSCPSKCISMKWNSEGFLYPYIDNKKCIECGICLKKCPNENLMFHRHKPNEVWAAKEKDEASLLQSASGGVADALSKTMLEAGGVIYGAGYNKDLYVEHMRVDNIDDIVVLRSSKYVQSDLSYC